MFAVLLVVLMVGVGGAGGAGRAGGAGSPGDPASWDAVFMEVSIFDLFFLQISKPVFKLRHLQQLKYVYFPLQLDAPDIVPDVERPQFRRRAFRRPIQQNMNFEFNCVTIILAVLVAYIAIWMYKIFQQ